MIEERRFSFPMVFNGGEEVESSEIVFARYNNYTPIHQFRLPTLQGMEPRSQDWEVIYKFVVQKKLLSDKDTKLSVLESLKHFRNKERGVVFTTAKCELKGTSLGLSLFSSMLSLVPRSPTKSDRILLTGCLSTDNTDDDVFQSITLLDPKAFFALANRLILIVSRPTESQIDSMRQICKDSNGVFFHGYENPLLTCQTERELTIVKNQAEHFGAVVTVTTALELSQMLTFFLK